MDLPDLTTTTRAGAPVRLSPFTLADADRVYDLCQDPEIQRWTTVPVPYPRSAADEWVTHLTPAAWAEVADGTFSTDQPGPELVWGVRLADGSTPDLWGSIGLKRLGGGVVEVGWWLGAGVRGQGIMRAAVALVVETAFSPAYPLRATEVLWYAMVGNLESAHIAQHTGFAYTGTVGHARCGSCWSAVIRAGDLIAPRYDWPDLSRESCRC